MWVSGRSVLNFTLEKSPFLYCLDRSSIENIYNVFVGQLTFPFFNISVSTP